MPTHSRSTRLDGLDAARGLAVVSMLIAHLSPVGGPANITEYLTAPLFAVVIGVAMGLVLEDRRPPGRTFLRDNALRGILLVLLGVLLQALYDQIVVVLPYLGLLIIVLAPVALLLHRVPIVTLGVAAGLAVLSPLVMERARERRLRHPDAPAWSSTSSTGSRPARPTASCRSSPWRSAGSPSRPCSGGPPGCRARGSSAACSSP